jgi:hypothetical protein
MYLFVTDLSLPIPGDKEFMDAAGFATNYTEKLSTTPSFSPLMRRDIVALGSFGV